MHENNVHCKDPAFQRRMQPCFLGGGCLDQPPKGLGVLQNPLTVKFIPPIVNVLLRNNGTAIGNMHYLGLGGMREYMNSV